MSCLTTGDDVSSPAGYPYSNTPLVPQWRSRRARALAITVVGAALVASVIRMPLSLASVDDLALTVVLPTVFGVVLAFAPPPSTGANAIARDLIVIGTALAVFAGDHVPLMIIAVPAVLAVSVMLAATSLGRSWWDGGRC